MGHPQPQPAEGTASETARIGPLSFLRKSLPQWTCAIRPELPQLHAEDPKAFELRDGHFVAAPFQPARKHRTGENKKGGGCSSVGRLHNVPWAKGARARAHGGSTASCSASQVAPVKVVASLG